MPKLSIREATDLALEIGRILLEGGSTTNRVELMMIKVCTCFGYPLTEAFVTPTGIFLSLSDGVNDISTSIKRIPTRRIDLGKITRVNKLVYKLEEISKDESIVNMSAAEFRKELLEIENERVWPEWLKLFCGGGTAGFFCLLFGGSWLEFAVAYLVGVMVSIALKYISILGINNFLMNALGAALIVIFAKTLDYWVPNIRVDSIIIGGIMLLVPGLAIVNAIRDTMSGDLVSGTARGAEALFIAVAIATGSGSMLKLWTLLEI
ncbi:MAG: threonine/serine exporter family protein [Candidatus Cloacimonadaceae bacterium]|nr:threonine/serine exporter family protein [Candidatus Cloacimonadaceae bacterium]MDP3114540.1 threonine/serine exporter family protein [Candidatus Cloacimonadaceae bacterium]